MGGFLERFRQEIDARERQAVDQAAAGRAQREAQQRIRDEAEASRRRTEAEHQEAARRHFKESGLPVMLKDLHDVAYGSKREVFVPQSLLRNPDSVKFPIKVSFNHRGGKQATNPLGEWSLMFRGETRTPWKFDFFEVDCGEDGTIRVGNTTILRSRWEGHLEILEKALEEAYYHPKTETMRYGGPSHSSGYDSGSGGGPD